MIQAPLTSYQLFHRCCNEWLDVDKGLSSLSFEETESLATAINMAVNDVWSLLPPHYRERRHTIEVKAPETGSITVAANSATIVGSLLPPPDFHCTAMIEGDTNPYEVIGRSTLNRPYVGSSGAKNATRYYDAHLLPWPIERILHLREYNGMDWNYKGDGQPWRVWGETYYDSRSFRVEYRNVQLFAEADTGGSIANIPGPRPRPVLFLPRKIATPTTLELAVFIRPENLNLLGAQNEGRPLEYDEQVADFIVRASGYYLRTNRRFREDLKQGLDMEKEIDALRKRVESLSPVPATTLKSIGTPFGH